MKQDHELRSASTGQAGRIRASASSGWTWALAALLLLAVGHWWHSQPTERFFGARTLTVDGAAARPDSGQAYWLPIADLARSAESDKDGVSRVEMFEDGVALRGHQAHADIRQLGDGRYSHWGRAILFSASDGSDPRSNGKAYSAALPPAAPAWAARVRVVLWLAALLCALNWLHLWLGGSWRRALAWATATASVAVAVAYGATLMWSPVRQLETLGDQFRHDTNARIDGDGMKSAEHDVVDTASQRPRTRHLLRTGRDLTIAENASTPRSPESPVRAFSAEPTAETEIRQGFAKMVEGAALMAEGLKIDATDLESITLELEVARGGPLRLRLKSVINEPPSRHAGLVSFPVSRARGVQSITLRRPAAAGSQFVRQIRIEGEGGDDAAIVKLVSARYSLRLDVFGEQPSGFGPIELAQELRPALWQSATGTFSLPIEPGDGSLLKLAVGALTEAEDTSLSYRVSTVDADGERQELGRGEIRAADAWQELAFQLPERGVESILLQGQRVASRSALLWAAARVIDTSRPPERVFLVLADTLRADALGSYGRAGNPTPVLDRLASQGVRFDRAFSQSYWTRPSMSSIMTGHYVAATGVYDLDDKLPESYDTLAEKLARHGFTTVGLTPMGNAGPHAGLDQGYDHLLLMRSAHETLIDSTSQVVSRIVLPLLERYRDDDLFFYLHVLESHGPYGPAPAAPADLELPVGGEPVEWRRQFDRPWNPEPTAEQRVALYHYDVRQLDKALGSLFGYVEQQAQAVGAEPPVIAFLSDHGEHLGERQQWGHSFADLYPELVQVPLIVAAPGRLPAGVEISAPVEVRRLGATILDLIGVDPESTEAAAGDDELVAHAPASSLLPMIEARQASSGTPTFAITPAFAITSAEDPAIAAFSLYGADYSYVARVVEGESKLKIYSDSQLGDAVEADWPRWFLEPRLLNLREKYLASQEEIRQQGWAQHVMENEDIDAEALQQLRALGYIQD